MSPRPRSGSSTRYSSRPGRTPLAVTRSARIPSSSAGGGRGTTSMAARRTAAWRLTSRTWWRMWTTPRHPAVGLYHYY
eukprot:1194964-Prorocentrum_minimum.AAC.2